MKKTSILCFVLLLSFITRILAESAATGTTSAPGTTSLAPPVTPSLPANPNTSLPQQILPLAPALTPNASGPSSPLAPVSPLDQTGASLGLSANEAQRMFTVSVANPTAATMNVLGVQTTNGLYVVQFPTTIPAHASAAFSLLYFSQAGTNSVGDALRVLTDQGQVTVQIDHGRAPALQFDTTSLQWQTNETPSAKSVVLTLAAGIAAPKGVLAMGNGNAAQLVPLSSTSFRINVTPGSTAKAGSFPVLVNFEPALPDVVPVITCSVGN